MKLRSKLLLVALSVLVLPWAGWQLLRQMEALLRQGQEQALVASAEAMARALAARAEGLPAAGPGLFVQALARQPRLDAAFDDWSPPTTTGYADASGRERLRLGLGRIDERLYLRIELGAEGRERAEAHWPQAQSSDHLILQLDGALGAVVLRLANTASGPLRVASLDGSAPPFIVEGRWRDRIGGYALELRLPQGLLPERLGVEAHLIDTEGAQRAGTGAEPLPLRWRDDRRMRPLLPLLPAGMRARLVAPEGDVLALAGTLPAADAATELPWWRRQLYQWLLFAADPVQPDDGDAAHSDRPEVLAALAGEAASRWRRDGAAPRLLLSTAVPAGAADAPRAALLLEREQQTLLLTDRAVGGLLGGTLLALFAAGAVLLLFASRLGARIRRLRDAAEGALGRDGRLRRFPISRDRDEIGDLSRSFARLLDEVGTSQDYLRSLAGKLSHELNTPLAIVRGALDNLDAAALDPTGRACVERARSGSQRLAAIVRAMSEAARMEQAIAAAEFERIDLCALIRDCAEGYRGLLAPRRLELALPESPLSLDAAPDLLVQALDKLIDNARAFTPDVGWVRIALERAADGAVLRVVNAGPPLPAAMRHRLFESLVSLRPERRDDGVHLGFGLYLVRLVAEAHGGSAHADNLASGDGVAFELRLASAPRAIP